MKREIFACEYIILVNLRLMNAWCLSIPLMEGKKGSSCVQIMRNYASMRKKHRFYSVEKRDFISPWLFQLSMTMTHQFFSHSR